MSLFASGLYVSLTALLIVALTYRVIKFRQLHKVGIGDGGHQDLNLAMRVHGNLLENAPIVLLLLVLAEYNGLAEPYVHAIGTAWIVARLLHAIGLTKGQGGVHKGRFWGVIITWLVILTLAIVNIGFFFMA